MAQNSRSSPELLRPRPTTATINNVGKFRLLNDLEPIEVTFILLAFVSIVGAGIITVVRINDSPRSSPDFTFALLLFINLLFILYYVVFGVFCERPFELIISIIATAIVMLYCIVEYIWKGYNDRGEVHDLKLGRLIVISVVGPIDIGLGIKIAYKFYTSKNLIFRTVGGNALLQNMCQTMFFFTAFLKFDFQLVISLLVLILNVSHSLTKGEKAVLGVGVPISFFWMILGFLMIRYENIKVSFIFWIIGLLEPTYIIWLFVKTANQIDAAKKNDNNQNVVLFCIFAAGILGLLLRTLIFVWSYFIFKNFNKGLKEKVYQHMSAVPIRSTSVESQQNNPNYNSMQSS
ncbi:uncharacterized protein LOC101241780 isoform X1 [Hydra vulgaris]|uniref:uncharacterized protein LOC101241780 isoform X1 n=1 Tax=Hydra vulgaris TaxID=6087 RepID=UPI001F5F2D31|nr:uncharacterized protein LOC101241780 isoform X1 [Hydra vulgaris]